MYVAIATKSQKTEGTAKKVDDPLRLHFGKLTGQRTAINTKVFRQLYSAEGNFKIAGCMILSLDGKIRQ